MVLVCSSWKIALQRADKDADETSCLQRRGTVTVAREGAGDRDEEGGGRRTEAADCDDRTTSGEETKDGWLVVRNRKS